MEGTKHEKAVLVILSYIVGLTSGFIAFGLAQPSLQSEMVLEENVQPVYQDELTAAEPQGAYEEQEASSVNTSRDISTSTNIVNVEYTDGKLVVTENGTSQLLSINRNTLNLQAASYTSKQGVHFTEPVYVVSPDNHFVFFCEQATAEDTCQSFIYDIQAQMIYFVTDSGTKVSLSHSDAALVSWDGGKLIVGDKQSQDTTTPWKL